MAFKVETTWKGIYVVSEENIANYRISGEATSKGLLVPKHYDAVKHALALACLLKEGKIKESVAGFYHTEEEMEKAYDLEKVLTALEKQLNLFTEGEYEAVKAILQDDSHRGLDDHKYWGEIQDIWFEIKKLQEDIKSTGGSNEKI